MSENGFCEVINIAFFDILFLALFALKLFSENRIFEAIFIFVSWFHEIKKKKNEVVGAGLWRILIADGFG